MCMLAGLSACNSKAIQSVTKNVVTSQTIWDDYFVGNIIFGINFSPSRADELSIKGKQNELHGGNR